MLLLTKKQAEYVRALLHTGRSEVGLDVADACTFEDFARALADAHELLALWRALDGGTLPVTSGIRRLLERERDFLISTLPQAEHALERVRAGDDAFGGTFQEQEAYVLACMDDVIEQLCIVRELLFAAENARRAQPESAARA